MKSATTEHTPDEDRLSDLARAVMCTELAMAKYAFVLLLFSVACYSNTFHCWFFSDDLLHLPKLLQAFSGHPEVLLANFTGPWLNDLLFRFYRPLTELAFALDFALFKDNPFGYHLTNLCLNSVNVLLMFLVSVHLLDNCSDDRKGSGLAAFLSALLFAASPLHVETVNWIVGRDEMLCSVFYLASLLCFLKAAASELSAHSALSEQAHLLTRARLIAIAVVLFACSLLSMEAGASLPLVIFFYCFVFGEGTIKLRLEKSWRWTRPFIVVLIVYIVMRALALGELIGGNKGSFGELLLLSAWERLRSAANFVFPVNAAFFPKQSPFVTMCYSLYIAYAVLAAVRVLRWPFLEPLGRMLIFLSGWLIATIAPVLPSWHIYDNLMGSRVAYFATVPLALAVIFLIVPLSEGRGWHKAFSYLGTAWALVACIGFGILTFQSNLPWIEASANMKAYKEQIAAAVESLPANANVLPVDWPWNEKGAHTLYTHEMMESLLQPPLHDHDLSQRISSLRRSWFVDRDRVDKRLIAERMRAGALIAFRWNDEKRSLELVNWRDSPPVDLTFAPLRPQSTKEGYHCWLLRLSPPVEPSSVDFLIADFARLDCDAPDADMYLYWRSDGEDGYREKQCLRWSASGRKENFMVWCESGAPTFKSGRARFNLGEHRQWQFCDPISEIVLFTKASMSAEIRHFRLLGERVRSPLLRCAAPVSNDGVIRPRSKTLNLSYDARNVPSANSVFFEVSKNLASFADYSHTYRERSLCERRMKGWQSPDLNGEIELRRGDFPAEGLYEIRVSALAKDGSMEGYPSVSLPIWIDKD
ncbi:MAG TPA: hypothetical protein V6D17_01660 [Candidatus Obscuribacterales bacterium]